VIGAAPLRRTSLAAGPLSLELDDGGLRYVRLGERELIRRVYVAVRDGGWVTIPMTVTEQTISSSEDAFSVDLVAEMQKGPVHFRWKGTIRGDARGLVRFEMDGEALSTFKRNRVGICVLHPIETCAGQPCRVRHPDGTVEDGAFPRLVAPHQPFLNVRALSYEIEPGVVAEVQFEGDVWETEDQRNWADHSFKSYSTPIDLPKPVEVKAGTRIKQAITIRLVPEALARRAPSSSRVTEIDFALTDETAPLPALGTCLEARAEPLTSRERSRLAALKLQHLRAELVPSREDFPAALAQALAGSEALGLPLELAVWLTPAPRDELELLGRALAEARPRLSALLVLPLDRDTSSSPEALRAVRALVPEVLVAGGSNVYFTELNRNRAPASEAQAFMFPSCPTVHMMDETTVAENLGPLPWIVETVRSFGGDRPVGLSPVLLRPPPAPPPRLGAEDLSTFPRYVDVRQTSLLAAGWTACHVGRAARAGFARATYHLTTGWRGLMYGETGPRLPAAFPSEPGAVYPLYHVFADLAELAGAQVVGTRSSAPILVEGTALRRGSQLRLLLANLTGEPQTVRLPAPLAGGRLRRLDQTNLTLATREPEAYRDAPALESTARTLVMGAHELARIDVDG
jgi:hypothetical protein